jgi:RNA-directed DNA polymerase
MTTKLVSKTQKAIQVIALEAKEDPNCKLTSLVHLLTEDFVIECFRELNRKKSPGIDGVTVNEFEEQLDENLADLVSVPSFHPI